MVVNSFLLSGDTFSAHGPRRKSSSSPSTDECFDRATAMHIHVRARYAIINRENTVGERLPPYIEVAAYVILLRITFNPDCVCVLLAHSVLPCIWEWALHMPINKRSLLFWVFEGTKLDIVVRML